MESSGWRSWGRYIAAAAGATVISVFAFVLRDPVPVLDWIDLGIHELGHILVPGPRMLHFLAGSAAQVLFPVGLAVYFGWRQRDLAGSGLCLAWAGTSAWDVSVYIADAPTQALPLIGGGTHDWGYLLGPRGWDALDRADSIAGFVDVLGMAMAAAGIGLALWPALRRAVSRRPGIVPEMADAVGDPDPREAAGVPGPSLPSPGDDPWLAAARLPFYSGREEGGP